MAKLKIIAYYIDNNEPVFVPKRIIDNLNKKTIILSQHIEEVPRRKLVIKYRAIKSSARGVMELYDMGPDTSNKKESEGEK